MNHFWEKQLLPETKSPVIEFNWVSKILSYLNFDEQQQYFDDLAFTEALEWMMAIGSIRVINILGK